jgi:hypothetical protein
MAITMDSMDRYNTVPTTNERLGLRRVGEFTKHDNLLEFVGIGFVRVLFGAVSSENRDPKVIGFRI